jgi:hypothetical protein
MPSEELANRPSDGIKMGKDATLRGLSHFKCLNSEQNCYYPHFYG